MEALGMKDIVVCTREHHRTHDERLNADGATPPEQPPSFDLWPLQVKVSPARKPGADYVGLLWVSARDGRPGGEVYRIIAETRDSDVLLHGYVTAYRRRGR
jgi:hypothetical protein